MLLTTESSLGRFLPFKKIFYHASEGSFIGDQRRAGVNSILNLLIWVLETELKAIARAVCDLNDWAISPSPEPILF